MRTAAGSRLAGVLAVAAFVLFVPSLRAADPYLVKRFTITPWSTNLNSFAAVNGSLLFRTFGTSDSTLWRSDGTDHGTVPFMSVTPSMTGQEAVSGNVYYFVLRKTDGVYELWRSDATPGGTFVIASLPSAPDSGSGVMSIRALVPFRGGVFFSAYDAAHGFEPWFTDGTAAGTAMVTDLLPGIRTSYLGGAARLNASSLLLPGETRMRRDIYTTDATAAGTTLLATLPLTPTRFTLSAFTSVNGLVYFVDSGEWNDGFDLWRSDGTPAGTFLLHHVDGHPPSSLFGTSGKVFLFASRQDFWTADLWTSDGTAAGTQLVQSGVSWPECGACVASAPDAIYWIGETEGAPYQLWRSDGSATGTTLLYDFPFAPTMDMVPATPVWINGSLYFAGYDDAHGLEPWVSDGTTAGTKMLFDVIPGPGSSNPANFIRAGANVYFTVDDGTHPPDLWPYELWALPLTFTHGDANGDGAVTVADLFYLLNNIFSGGPAPLGSGDANGDGQVNAADVFYLLNHFFLGGPGPK